MCPLGAYRSSEVKTFSSFPVILPRLFSNFAFFENCSDTVCVEREFGGYSVLTPHVRQVYTFILKIKIRATSHKIHSLHQVVQSCYWNH